MNRLDNLIAEIEEDFSQYKSAGLIDRASLYRWANIALKNFGQSICSIQETVITVEKGFAPLPKNFFSLHLAVKCSYKGWQAKEEDIPILQNTLVWKERVEKQITYNQCNPCCKEVGEVEVTENYYFNDKTFTVAYDNFMPLRLAKGINRDSCANSCVNKIFNKAEHEINIQNNTLYTNFTEGLVYMQYYGIEMDENGLPLVPQTPKAHVETYLEYHLKRRLLEKIMSNGDDVNAINLLKYYVDQERMSFPLAMADAKYQTLTPDSYRKLAMINKRDMLKVESLLPFIQKFK